MDIMASQTLTVWTKFVGTVEWEPFHVSVSVESFLEI